MLASPFSLCDASYKTLINCGSLKEFTFAITRAALPSFAFALSRRIFSIKASNKLNGDANLIVRAGTVKLLLAVVQEIVDTGVLEEPADDGSYMNIFR